MSAHVRRESESIFHRVHSIAEDAAFVEQVQRHYPDLPLVPNLRSGAWYTDRHDEPAYFKSTDGHTNNWSFNLRRPNLHILPRIIKHAGLLLVDSTRAGKRIPDALSKTVPIWCAVLNRVMSEKRPWDTALYTPPGCVSPQEHNQIENRLVAWASQLAASAYTLPALDRPLRPIWITPATSVFPTFPPPQDRLFYPIVCISASKQVLDGVQRRAAGFTYIQGSGDDHEQWSMGLTPALFWRHREAILAAQAAALPDLIREIVQAASDNVAPDLGPSSPGTPIQHISGRITISTLAAFQPHPNTASLLLTPAPHDNDDPRTLVIQTPEGKRGQHHFRTVVLPRAIPFVWRHLQDTRIATVCIVCPTGADLSVGVAVAALALFFHPDGTLCAHDNVYSALTKDVLKTRLQWIIASYPHANPSRRTLKRVNDFLLSPFAQPPELLSLGNTPSQQAHDDNVESQEIRI